MDIETMLKVPETQTTGKQPAAHATKEGNAIGNGKKVSELEKNFKKLVTTDKNTVPKCGNSGDGLQYGAQGLLNFNSTVRIQGSGFESTDDDVFEKLSFPHAYKKVRAMRMGAMKMVRLGQMGGLSRVVTNTPGGLAGFDVPEDDRQFQVANFHIPVLRKNVSTSVKKVSDDTSQLICMTCPEKHFFTGQEPVLVVLADQHFPPSLPSTGNQCAVIMRCEDAMLHELPGLLREFFSGSDGRVMLPDGSAVVFGSLSHLAAEGWTTTRTRWSRPPGPSPGWQTAS
jgi:hypothetical protein